MFQKILRSVLYALLTTLVYLIAANIGYYYINRRSMFANIYYYDWVEYAIVAAIIFFSSVVIESIRNLSANRA